MTLEQHIEDLTKKVQNEIGRIGLKAAQDKIGVNRPYLSRLKCGKQRVSANKLIEFAKALGIESEIKLEGGDER